MVFMCVWVVVGCVWGCGDVCDKSNSYHWGDLDFKCDLLQWHSQGLPGWASRPPGRPKWGRKWSKFEQKWEKIQENEERLSKHCYLAHPGVRGWLRPWSFAIPPTDNIRLSLPITCRSPLFASTKIQITYDFVDFTIKRIGQSPLNLIESRVLSVLFCDLMWSYL